MNETQQIYELRRALADACETCHDCRGAGSRSIPGGTMACSRCGPWRALLRRQKRRDPLTWDKVFDRLFDKMDDLFKGF